MRVVKGSTVYSVGACPVCFSSGTVLILISTSSGSPIFHCPACETAWNVPPLGLDSVQSLTELAPDGARFATKEEAERISSGHILAVAYEEWSSHLKGIAEPE
jgi:hypothetical protein